jgi:hypothetical protein
MGGGRQLEEARFHNRAFKRSSISEGGLMTTVTANRFYLSKRLLRGYVQTSAGWISSHSGWMECDEKMKPASKFYDSID